MVDVERFDAPELVGLERGLVEWYRPHRVVRQLGIGLDGDALMDQDLVTTGDPAGEEEEGGGEEGEVASEEEDGGASEEDEDEGGGEGEVSAFVFKRTKRRYLAQIRRQRSVNQCFCASELSEALGDEGGDYEGFSAPKSSEGLGNEGGDEKSNDSRVRGNKEERLRNLERLVRLVEKGKYVCIPLNVQSRKLDIR